MSRWEMLDCMTWEEWSEHLAAFTQDPDDEQRKDDRSAVNAIWALAPHLEEGAELPGFVGPEYESGTKENVGESWERLQALKKRIVNGQLNSKTSDPTDH